MRQIRADHILDITADVCPMTYVRTRLALEQLAPGQILAVRLRGAEPERNVPQAAEQHGHTVLGRTPQDGGATLLYLRRG